MLTGHPFNSAVLICHHVMVTGTLERMEVRGHLHSQGSYVSWLCRKSKSYVGAVHMQGDRSEQNCVEGRSLPESSTVLWGRGQGRLQ